MALQDSIIKLTGNIGDISFFKTKNGYGARSKGGVDANRIKSDPAFARTRENGAEFGRAGTAGKILRTALRTYLENTKDGQMANRLTREMMKIIRTDATSIRGERNVVAGDILLLKGFEFNEVSRLASTFFAPYTTAIERSSGNVSVALPAFVPGDMVAKPEGATHFRFVLACADVNFATGDFNVAAAESAYLALGPQTENAQTLSAALPPASVHPIFVVVGLQFTQLVNGAHYALRNGTFNALTVVDVNRI